MANLPSGTVTFLFTDIEGSTRLWEQHPEAMREALARHDALLTAGIRQHGGQVVKSRGEGDSFFAVFARASDAVTAAGALQQALHSEPWPLSAPLRVRMALHTGEAEQREGDYYGPAVNRCARLRAAAHGGQVLLSLATQELVRDALPDGVSLKDLGLCRLRDLQRPETVFQLLHPDLPGEFPALRSLDTLPHNLPQQLTSFIGREREIDAVKRLLAPRDEGKGMRDEEGTGRSHPSSLIPHPSRLLTLTGSGGTGKSRLSLQVAADLLEEYADGVWLVELAALADPALVPQAVATALGVREEPGKPVTQTLADFLKSKRLLLILDNCEHLLAACAALVEGLLRSCPHIRILASSREGLNIPGEQVYRVPSLSLPDLRRLPPTPESLTQYEAVRLFIDRALLSQASFAVTNQNAPAVAQVCYRLDGIPLAIELAAARVRALPVEQIAARLDDRFRLLTGGSRTALPRQQTLRASIDWSCDLLTEAERTLLRHLSVFAGGWTLEAAEAVCEGESVAAWEVLDRLTSLVDKSLVVYDEQEGEGRYRLLETVRRYARDRLLEAGRAAAARDRHRDWFLALAEKAELALEGPEQGVWLDRLEQEHDNLRAVLSWVKEVGDAEVALRLGGALWCFWSVRGYLAEGWEQLAQIRSLPGANVRAVARARALTGAGALAHDQGNLQAAHSLFEESLTLARELDDPGLLASSVLNLGLVAQDQGDYEGARSLFEQSLVIDQKLGNKWGIARSLNNLGRVARDQGGYVAARSLFEECLTIQRQLGDMGGIAASLNNLGDAAHNLGDVATAHTFFEQSLAIWRELGDRIHYAYSLLNLGLIIQARGDGEQAAGVYAESLALFQELGHKSGIAACLKELGGVAGSRGQPESAARLHAAAQALREAIGAPLPPSECAAYERQLATAQTQLGAKAFAAAWAEGRAMSLEAVVAGALDGAAGG